MARGLRGALGVEGLGPENLRALALVAEVVYGTLAPTKTTQRLLRIGLFGERSEELALQRGGESVQLLLSLERDDAHALVMPDGD